MSSSADRAFVFLAGSTWLDFVNTELNESSGIVDLLGSIDDFEAWAAQARLCETNGSAVGQQAGFETDDLRNDALNQVRYLRRELRKQAERFAAGHSASEAFVQLLNDHLAMGMRRPRVSKTRHDFDLRFELPTSTDARTLLSLIAESAAHYLTNGQLGRLKSCEHDGCILFFYDTSKNNARRWCSMATCGNRAKARAHYQRKRHSPRARETSD